MVHAYFMLFIAQCTVFAIAVGVSQRVGEGAVSVDVQGMTFPTTHTQPRRGHYSRLPQHATTRHLTPLSLSLTPALSHAPLYAFSRVSGCRIEGATRRWGDSPLFNYLVCTSVFVVAYLCVRLVLRINGSGSVRH